MLIAAFFLIRIPISHMSDLFIPKMEDYCMPIHETSFRIGCGRYQQEPHILHKCADEIARYGTKAFIIGGPIGLSLTQSVIEKSLANAAFPYEIKEYTGTCNEENAQNDACYMKEHHFDIVVGVGGGVIMDYAKLVAYWAKLPIVNIPTSSATCAAYTPLSVRYTPEGRTVGSRHYDQEVTAVLVDTALLIQQPPRLFLSGVFDALAKYVEIKQRFNDTVQDFPLGLDWAYVFAKKSFQVLADNTAHCLTCMEKGLIDDVFERVIFTVIAVTGVISGIARGSNQSALAHKFYEGTRKLYYTESRPYLHGEIVGVGLLMQNHFNNETDINDLLLNLMKKYQLPACITDVGLTPSREVQDLYYEELKGGSAINEKDPEELRKLRAGLEYLWNL